MKLYVLGAGLTLMTATPRLMAATAPSVIDSQEKAQQVFQRPEQGNIRPRGEREKILWRESHGKAMRQPDRTVVDFSAVNVNGQRIQPVAVPVTASSAEAGDSLVSLRVRWYSEMVQSVESVR